MLTDADGGLTMTFTVCRMHFLDDGSDHNARMSCSTSLYQLTGAQARGTGVQRQSRAVQPPQLSTTEILVLIARMARQRTIVSRGISCLYWQHFQGPTKVHVLVGAVGEMKNMWVRFVP